MSFKRIGTPEPMQTIKFRCTQCGNEATALTDGKCSTCNTQRQNTEVKELEDFAKLQKEAIEQEEEKEAGVEPPKEKE